MTAFSAWVPDGGRNAVNRLDGKVALMAGAAGIGPATARLMVEAGARVAIGDVLDELGRQTAAAIGGAALYTRLDVTSEADWQAAIAATTGVRRARHPGQQCRDVSWQEPRGGEPRRLGAAVRGQPDRGLSRRQAGIACIARAGGARGIGCGSTRSIRARPTPRWAIRWWRCGRVSSAQRSRHGAARGAGAAAARPPRTADDIAKGILFLASDDAGFMTGAGLVVEGGITAR